MIVRDFSSAIKRDTVILNPRAEVFSFYFFAYYFLFYFADPS